MRADRLFCYLRFTRSRSLAQDLIEGGTVRCNGIRMTRTSHPVQPGDVLTFPFGNRVRVVEVLELPDRRAGAARAASFYREVNG